jgi:hypothetical protein
MKNQGIKVEYKKDKALNEGWGKWKVWEIEFEHIMSETKMENPRRSYLITKMDENNI